MPTHAQTIRHGYTLVEVVISSLIVGGILVGALNVLGGSVQTNRVAATRLDVPELGFQLMAEILALPYEDPDEPGGTIGRDSGETGSSRVDYDDVDDYHGWNMNPPEYKDGTPVPGATDWERDIVVRHYDPSTGNSSGSDTGVKLITVTIVSPSGVNFELHALRSKWGSLQQPPAADTTVVTSIDAQLQIGSLSEPAFSSIHLKNHAND